MAKKIDIVGASNFVNRMFEACGSYQWARELLKNSLEAGATRIEFGIEWQAVAKFGVYRRTIADNGCGMDRHELVRFFSTLGAGDKVIGGIHDNFGVGAKIATLPWNPEGVVVLSYKHGSASMIQIVLNPSSGEYELVEFAVGGHKSSVVDPNEIDWSTCPDEIDWRAVKPAWVGDYGTVVVLLGSTNHPDTVLGNPEGGEQGIKGLSVYLNTRFWDLSQVEVTVVELRSERRESWPVDPAERDDARRPNNRRIMGARHWIEEVTSPAGRLFAKGVVPLSSGRVPAEWYLWHGERPAIHSYAKKGGYIAIKYKDELFELTQNKAHFRWFGVIESKVQQNLTLILEPKHYDGHNRWGIHPDQSRNRIIFTGDGEKGVAIPLSEWGLEFSENMPEPIRAAIQEARGDLSGSLDDEEYRKRLQDKFGDRWRISKFFQSRVKPTVNGGDATEKENALVSRRASKRHTKEASPRIKELSTILKGNGSVPGVERSVPVDVPKYRFGHPEEFEHPWHIALWAPNDVDGPYVVINSQSPVLVEMIKYHRDRYPDIYAEEVTRIVLRTFGEIAACKIAHTQKLTQYITEQEVDDLFRTEQALTTSLMGLIAEDALISQRLAKLGPKRSPGSRVPATTNDSSGEKRSEATH
jgi:hypothetical protein